MAARTLREVGSSRENNLELIRYVAACLVIVSHSFPLTMGASAADPLSALTQGQTSFGGLAVAFFLLMRGYLITGSALRRKSAKEFFPARCSRIFPELAFVVLACILIVGPLFTTVGLGAYFSSPSTWRYLFNIVLIPQHSLPGVFEANPYPAVVNGSLWILSVEFFCYVLCFACMRLGLLRPERFKWLFAVALVGFLTFVKVVGASAAIVSYVRPVMLFVIGAAFWVYADKVPMHAGAAAGAMALFVVGLALGLTDLAMVFFLPYAFFYVAFVPKAKRAIGSKSDFSYAMFLWAFPVQQVLVALSHGQIAWYVNAGLGMAISLLLGVVTHACVERGIMGYLHKEATRQS